jgi:hypothetical protein
MTRTPNKLYIRQFGAMMIINDQQGRRKHRGRKEIASYAVAERRKFALLAEKKGESKYSFAIPRRTGSASRPMWVPSTPDG